MSNLDSPLKEDRPFASDPSTKQDLATWWQRALALVVDFVLIGVIAGVVLFVTVIVRFYLAGPTAEPSVARWPPSTSTFHPAGVYWYELIGIGIASILYFAVLDGRSQTPGKKTLGIAVRDQTTGQPIGALRALVRWIIFLALWGIFVIPGMLNALSPSWDQRRQAWHDHAVGSVVIEVD